MQNQQNLEALQEWKRALQAEPRNALYHNLCGLALQAVGRVREARNAFQKATQLNPRLADAYSNLAYSLWSEGQDQEAATQFEKALRLRPADRALHLARGLLFASAGDVSKAVDHFDQAQPWPADAETRWIVFTTYLRSRRWPEALAAVRSLPEEFRTQMAVAQAFCQAGRAKEAIPFLLKARERNLADLSVLLLLANAHLDSGQPESALRAIEEIPEARRLEFEVIEVRGSILLKLGRRFEAQKQFERLPERYPTAPESYIHATQIPLEDQDWNRVLAILNEGLGKLPDHWLLLYRRAMAYRLSGSLEPARDDLLKALRHDGDVALVSAALGELYGKLDDLPSAAEVFHEALGQTGRPEFQYALALALERMGDDSQALIEFKKAVSLFPRNARARFAYGKLLQRTGQLALAKQELEQARALDPKLSDALYALSRLYSVLGQTDLASRTAQEFLGSKQKQAGQ
ncbi:MAG: tetratricopeptide repeat protein [Acidobacteria bacterium]|nr:tetratricopeptide repeat protein [Acidobacteriota bacterium]MCI0625327.1 tetratricopeptide repeat protein [Acidobacteriota bacterium]MCI0720789.1 tetratricopeptide repeat protein [Acidobacteriota bacterium]